MAFDNPMEMVLRASEIKQQRQQQKDDQWGNVLGSLGALGQGIAKFGEVKQQKKQKEQMHKALESIRMDSEARPEVKQVIPFIDQLVQVNPAVAGELLMALMKGSKTGAGDTELTVHPDGSMTIGGTPYLGPKPPVPSTGTPAGAPVSAPAAAPTAPLPTFGMKPIAPNMGSMGAGGSSILGLGSQLGLNGPSTMQGLQSPMSPPDTPTPPPVPPVPPTPAGRDAHFRISGNKAAEMLTRVPKAPSAVDNARAGYMGARAMSSEVSALSQIENNIDPGKAGRNTPVGAAASTIRRVNNGIKLLETETVTNANIQSVVGDIDSIVTQGAATVEGRKALQGSNLYSHIQEFKSWLSKHPENTPVPPGIVKLYKNILQDLGPISESFIKDRVNQQWEMYRGFGEKLAGRKNYSDFKDRVIKGYTLPTSDQGATGGSGLTPQEQAEFEKLHKKYGGTP